MCHNPVYENYIDNDTMESHCKIKNRIGNTAVAVAVAVNVEIILSNEFSLSSIFSIPLIFTLSTFSLPVKI